MRRVLSYLWNAVCIHSVNDGIYIEVGVGMGLYVDTAKPPGDGWWGPEFGAAGRIGPFGAVGGSFGATTGYKESEVSGQPVPFLSGKVSGTAGVGYGHIGAGARIEAEGGYRFPDGWYGDGDVNYVAGHSEDFGLNYGAYGNFYGGANLSKLYDATERELSWLADWFTEQVKAMYGRVDSMIDRAYRRMTEFVHKVSDWVSDAYEAAEDFVYGLFE